MSNNRELLEVVDETGKILRLERRDVIHREGLLRRDAVVWFWNDKGEILFEIRAKTKDTNPGKLGSSCGGHPNPKESVLACAVREIKEEMGLTVEEKDLALLETTPFLLEDMGNGNGVSHMRAQIAYHWNGKIEELTPQPEEVDGYEWWPIEKIINLSEKEKERFSPGVFNPKTLSLFHKIQSHVPYLILHNS